MYNVKQIFRQFSVLFILTLLTLYGCSKPTETIPEKDKEAFEKAVVNYCKAKNMGMVIKSFEKADIEDDSATVICKMKAAEGPGISAKWTFQMKKEQDSWQVISIDR